MKKICWVTPDCFLDTDLDYTLMSSLLKQFEIHWIVVLGIKNRFCEDDFLKLKEENSNLKVEFIYFKRRARDPRRIHEYMKIYRIIKREKADIVYLNMVPDSPFFLPMWWRLDKKKTIITAHQGDVHDGFKMKRISKLVRNLAYPYAKTVNMFSKSQAAIFKKNYPVSHVVTIPLGLKDFGKPTIKAATAEDIPVRFLSFGIINYPKNIDLLIDAACNIYEKGYRGFVISINGGCQNWDFYQQKIRYPEIFELDIRKIDNDEIPNLFAKAHYFVQPYRIVTQSGPMKIAFNYNTPVVVSDLPGFTDETVNGINGYIFEHENVESLESQMINVLEKQKEYGALIERMKLYVDENYSSSTIANKYIEMFNEIE